MPDDLTTFMTYPFLDNHAVKPLDPAVDEEPPRHGEGGVDCHTCDRPDDSFLWSGERWRVARHAPSPFKGVVTLTSREHFDGFADMPPEYAADYASIAGRLERALIGIGNIARVHSHRWADGGAHFHVWFYPRPYGQLQLRGTFMDWWMFLLPDLPDDELAAAHNDIAHTLAADEGVAYVG